MNLLKRELKNVSPKEATMSKEEKRA